MDEQNVSRFCPQCGTAYGEGASFCPKCGNPVGSNAGTVNPYAAPKTTAKDVLNKIKGVMQKIQKFFPLGGIASGILSVIFGLSTWGMGVGYWEISQTYGGDAYTGMQNASAQAANNVQALAKLTRFGLGALLVVAGIALICYFVSKLDFSEE